MTIKKTIVLLGFLFISTAQIYGQWDLPTITFKNGDIITGVKFHFLSKEFQFFKDMKSKPVKYTYDSIQRIEINYRNDKKILYEYWKIKDKKKGGVLEVVIEGYVTLYQYIVEKPDANDVRYYLRRQGENEVTLYSKSELRRRLSNQKNKILDYFGDCELLKSKIISKEIKSRKLKDIVRFYNENCQ